MNSSWSTATWSVDRKMDFGGRSFCCLVLLEVDEEMDESLRG